MHLLYQERQKTQRQYTEADFSGNGILGDQALLSILGSIDFVAKEIHYYGVCTTDSCRASLKNKPK